MTIPPTWTDVTPRQREILARLNSQSCRQGALQADLGISAATLHYHLGALVRGGLVEKVTVGQVGNARINDIRVHPSAVQRVRGILDQKVEQWTLVTGFGALGEGYRLPDEALAALAAGHYRVDRVVCFTSQDAIEARNARETTERLAKVGQHYIYPYEAYRDLSSPFFRDVERILQAEMQAANLLIDLTPLSKLYSLRLLELSNQYRIPCFYLGRREGRAEVLWMTPLQLVGGLHTRKMQEGR